MTGNRECLLIRLQQRLLGRRYTRSMGEYTAIDGAEDTIHNFNFGELKASSILRAVSVTSSVS